MSAYDVDITLGAHVFAISSSDVPTEETVTVLDNLTIRWSFAENAPRPVQPDAMTCSLGLLTRDVDNLSDVDVGTPLQIIVSSAGTTVAAFTGRVAQMVTSPRTLKNADGTDGHAMIYQLDGVDYTIDLAELLVDLVRPAEAISVRLPAISDAVLAAGGPGIDWPPFSFDSTVHQFDAVDLAQQPALDLMLDHLRQLPHPSLAELPGLLLVVPRTSAGVLNSFDADWPILTTATIVWPPAVWAMIGGLLMIDPAGGPLPPGRAAGYAGMPIGLSIDGCRVELDGVAWIRSKFGAVDYVSVTGPNATAIAARTDAQPVKLALQSSLVYSPPQDNTLQEMADLYLPDPDVDRWAIDTVTWRPSDAELAALPFPLTPDTDALSISPYDASASDVVTGPTAYYAPVVIRDIPNELNPGSDLGYLAGTLSGVLFRIAGQLITVELGVERQLPKNLDAAPPVGTSWDDLAADFPAATWSVVDPRVSWYDARLAHG